MTASEKLRQERAKIITDMRALNEKAERENRDLNTEEKASFDKMKTDALALKERYERMEETEKLERELGESRGATVDPLKGRQSSNGEKSDRFNTPEYKRAFEAYVRYGDVSQLRALEVGTVGEGGYTVPTDTASEVVKALNRGSVVRQAGARVLATSKDTTIPVASVVTGTWEPEEDPFGNNADTDPTFTAFAAKAHKYTVGTKVSDELLSDSAVDIEQLIRALFVDAWIQASDDAYVNGAGSGSNQPEGVMTGGTDKVVTSATTFTAAELRAHYFALPQQYRRDPSCAWIGNDAFLSAVSTLAANSNNEFLWVPGLREGESDRLMGKPIFSSAAVNKTFVANAEVAVFGAFKYYQIVDRIRQAGVKRLNELFATTGQVGFIGSWRTDGKVLVPDAFRVLKLASS